jgi:cation:H+ antiporter
MIIFFFCLFVIIKSGALLVKTLVNISRYLRLSEYAIAFILMAFATSVPELFIGLTSAISKASTISLGNIIGANIVNLTLALGLVILAAKGINVTSQTAKNDAWIIFFLALLPILLVFDGQLSRLDGLSLLLFFFWYVSRLFKQKEKFSKSLNSLKYNISQLKSFIKDMGLFVLGLILLLGAAWGAVLTASLVAKDLNLSLFFIGLILLALGTTLPEISFGFRSVLLKHEEMTLGNFIGSIAFNSLFILGLVAIIHPIQVDNFSPIAISAVFLVLSLIVFNIFLRSKERLSYKEGIILLVIYGFFLTIEVLVR